MVFRACINAIRLGVGLAVAGWANAATAQDHMTRWTCHTDEQQLVCRLERPAPAAGGAAPSDARLPAIVRELRDRPHAWRGRAVHIPLHTVPFDDSPLQPLAQAILCGPVAACRAEVVRGWDPRSLALLDFVDEQDPLLH